VTVARSEWQWQWRGQCSSNLRAWRFMWFLH